MARKMTRERAKHVIGTLRRGTRGDGQRHRIDFSEWTKIIGELVDVLQAVTIAAANGDITAAEAQAIGHELAELGAAFRDAKAD